MDKDKSKKRSKGLSRFMIILLVFCIAYNSFCCINKCVQDVKKYERLKAVENEFESVNTDSTLCVADILGDIASRILVYTVVTLMEIASILVLRRLITGKSIKDGTDILVGPNDTNVTFKDIAGLDEIKDELVFLVKLLKEDKDGISHKIPRGILLEGPPGNGKTMLAKALAHESGVNFIALPASDILNPYVGVASHKIKSIFKKASDNAPCIVFIDEIDAIGSSRVESPTGAADKEENATLTTLLNYLDGFMELKGVMVIAATNMASSLDPALLRPGRLDRHYTINNPDFKTREKLLKLFIGEDSKRTSVDIKSLAMRTYGLNSSELKGIVNEASLIALKNERDIPISKDYDDAILHVTLNGFEKLDDSRNLLDIKTTAYHEAGHAIVSYYLNSSTVHSISIRPITAGIGGYTLIEDKDESDFKPLKSIRDQILILYGGRASECKLMGGIDNASLGAESDIKKATEIAVSYITHSKGVDYTVFGSNGLNRVMEYTEELLSNLWDECISIVETNWKDIELISRELMERETISSERFKLLMSGGINE